jgi:ubiquinone biosynthesis O-methyltransferase
LGGNVIGLDAGEEVIEIAKTHSSSIRGFRRPEYVCCSVGILACNEFAGIYFLEEFSRQEDGRFDVVCALEVIEHVEQVPVFIESLARLAKPGASIFISSINKTLISYLLTIVMAEYVLRWVPRGVCLVFSVSP